jgi:hypothetical protein
MHSRSAWIAWIAWTVAAVLLCSILYLMLFRTKEGFVTEPTGSEKLLNFFHYQVAPVAPVAPVENPGGIPYTLSPGTAALLPQVDGAIETPGFPQKIQSLFKFLMNTTDPIAERDEKCRALGHPRLIEGTRGNIGDISEQSGCGWWFVTDPNVPSVGAFGYGPTGLQIDANGRQTPMSNIVPSSASLPVGGVWIYDFAEAIQKEEIKRCKKIETCSLISGSDGCGFCPSKGHGIPVTSTGITKYTAGSGDLDGSCPDAANLVTTTSNCPDIVLNARAFTGDFDYDINGNPIKNERYRRALKQEQTRIPDPCELENGRLTKVCRLRMALEVAKCTEGKGIYRIIDSEGNLSETDRLALYYVKRRGGLTIPASIWEPVALGPTAAPASAARPLSKADAEDTMARLFTIATSGPPSTARGAALWLLNETPFNPCDFEESDTGPFPLQCIQREFRKAGCQASGSAYPTNDAELRQYTGKTYGTIKTQFSHLYDNMNNQDIRNVKEQDETIQKCLGIAVKRGNTEVLEVSPNMCREQGIEYWFTTIPNIGQRRLYARRIFPRVSQLVGSSDMSGSNGYMLNMFLNAKGGVRGYTARTYVEVSGVAITATLTAPQGYSFWVNQQQVLATTGFPGVYARTLTPYMRSELEVRFEGSGAALNFGTPLLSFGGATPPLSLYLAQSVWKPVVSLQARKEGFTDDNNFLQLESPPATAQRGNEERWALPINGLSIKSIASRGIWMEATSTITCMLYWTGFTGEAPIWKMDQGNGGRGDTVLALQVIAQKPVLTLQTGTSIFRLMSTVQLSNPNKWLHIAIVFGARLGDTKMYINGANATDLSPYSNGTILVADTVFHRTVLGGPGFAGDIGWFHIYERGLSEAQIQRDLRYDDPEQSEVEDTLLVSRRNVGPR